MLPDNTDFNRKVVGRTGIGFAIFQFVVMIVDVVTFFLFHISYPVFHMLLEGSFITPESLLANAAFESFDVPMISGLLISTLVLFLLTIGLTIGVYRKKVVCAIMLILEVASYVIVPVWGLSSGRFILIESKYLVPIYTIYFGILPIMVLFIGYGIWGRSARSARLVKNATSVIRFLLVPIPVNFVIGCRALLRPIKTDFKNLDWKIVGRTGIGFAIFQFLGMTVGIIIFFLFFGIVTPEYLLAATAQFLLKIPGSAAWLITDLVLLLLTIGLTIGVYKKKGVCAILLLLGVTSYIIVAVWGLAYGGFGIVEPKYRAPIYAIYFGILSIIVLFLVRGIWGRSARAAKLVKRAAFVIVSLLVLIPIVFVVGSWAQLGSISGQIYTSNGDIISNEVIISCCPQDKNIHITSGDPAPWCLDVEAYGDYEISKLPASNYLISAYAADLSLFSESPSTVTVKKRQSTVHNIVLVPGGKVSGRVTGIDTYITEGKPLGVVCKYNLGEYDYDTSCYVSENGTYSLEDIPPGTSHIRVVKYTGHYADGLTPYVTITLQSGEEIIMDFSLTQ